MQGGMHQDAVSELSQDLCKNQTSTQARVGLLRCAQRTYCSVKKKWQPEARGMIFEQGTAQLKEPQTHTDLRVHLYETQMQAKAVYGAGSQDVVPVRRT